MNLYTDKVGMRQSSSSSTNYHKATVSYTRASVASPPVSTTPPNLQLLNYLSKWALRHKTELPVSSATTTKHSHTQVPSCPLPLRMPHTSQSPMVSLYLPRWPSISYRHTGTPLLGNVLLCSAIVCYFASQPPYSLVILYSRHTPV